jgi:hypothetical protein
MATHSHVEKNLENFMKTAKEELAKFERKEIEFQKMERNQRATQLNLAMPPSFASSARSCSSRMTNGPSSVPVT